MDRLERHSNYSKEIEDVGEAENVIDKVLNTGQNFYRAQAFEQGDFGDLNSHRSRRSRTQNNRASVKSIHSQRASFGLQSRHTAKSNKSMTPARSQGSKKSLHGSVEANLF